jgi:putative spermidine/putrescine transport system substrate-binding protein
MTSTKSLFSLSATTLCLSAALMSTPAAAADTLTVAVYGGVGEKAITQCVIAPFTKATGVKVVTDPGASAVTMTKLTQQKSTPVIDVAWMDGGVSEQAWTAGLLEPLDSARIPNLKNASTQARYMDGDKNYAASTGYYALGIVYNPKLVKTPPTSWKDLWKPEYADMVSLPSPQNAMGIPLFAHFISLYGGTLDNPQPAIDQLKKLKVAAFWDASGTITNMLQNEEVAVSPHFSTSAWTLIEGGASLKYVAPTDGAVANDIRIHLVKGTPRREIAEKFIDSIYTKDVANCMATVFHVGPYMDGVTLTPEVAKGMPWGENGSLKDLAIPDWLALAGKREALTRAWTSNLGRR